MDCSAYRTLKVESMDTSTAIVLGIALLILGGCLALVVFTAKRQGWKPVLVYVVSVIAIRLVIQFAAHNSGQFAQDIVPLLGAGVILWAWPRIAANRALDKASAEEDREDERSSHTGV